MSSLYKSRLPRVGIIGRPNVGKSTLFNVLTRSRQAVVKNQPGVTRDILIEPTEWWGKSFEVVDTGGLTEATDTFSILIREHVQSMLKNLDALIVVMDGKSGLVPEDRDVIRLAKEVGKPFCLVVNKVDKRLESDLVISEFYEFGVDVISTSFEQRSGVDEVVEAIKAMIPEEELEDLADVIKLAVVGKPNVGKSSLCNFLLKEKRMLVSDIAGTTVDPIEAQFRRNDRDFMLVDTAGLRRQSKRNKTGDGVEILSAYKSHSAIDKADIVLLVVDATQGPTDQDTKLAQYALEKHKALIMVANKSDLAKENIPAPREWFRGLLEREFHFFPNIPIQFISAKTGSGVDALFKKTVEIHDKLQIRIPTSKLNKFFYEVIRQAPAPVWGTRNIKFYYLTQTHQQPPSFIAFANHPDGVTPSYRRFLSKRLQKEYDLEGIPVRIFIMKSGKGSSNSVEARP